MKFCSDCGGHKVCQEGCTRTTPRIRYYQRTAYNAWIMLTMAANDEQRTYYSARLKAAEEMLFKEKAA